MLAWDRPGASPFEPFTGDWFMSAGTDDAAYKRFQHAADLSGATSATLSFRTSYDLEADYDYMFVEIHTAGQDDWTTLADNNGNTSDDTGLSCPATAEDASNWQADHPFLAHYQTKSSNGETCTPTGSSGEWNAATGNSGGWKLVGAGRPGRVPRRERRDLDHGRQRPRQPGSRHLGRRREPDDELGRLFDTSFETDDGGFTRPGPPAGTENPAVGWERAQSAPFIEGAGVSTNDTVYTGFGLEKLDSTADQQALLADVFSTSARRPSRSSPRRRRCRRPARRAWPAGRPAVARRRPSAASASRRARSASARTAATRSSCGARPARGPAASAACSR